MSKTDDLINEAIKNIDPSLAEKEDKENLDDDQDAIVEAISEDSEATRDERRKETVARIDLQQYVEKETYMRLAADFDNFRRRALKERKEWERQGKEKILRELLDVIDNFTRGLSQSKEDEGALATGMRMVLSQAEQILVSEGLQKIPTLGQIFDPNLHDAVARIKKEGATDGEIIEELKCGYRYSDRLLRPASVVVAESVSASKEKSAKE